MTRLEESISHLIQGVVKVRIEEIGGFLVVELEHFDSTDKSTIWFDLSQESDGTLRIIGLLTAIFQFPYSPFIGIEEPEFALHPGVLAALAELLEEASQTTHSPDLIISYLLTISESLTQLKG